DEKRLSLLGIIQARIAQINPQDKHRWPLRWLNWFNQG
ncbi:MAG: hypothetical protein RLY17_2045, partial [Pseudomonadota bacterium]